MNDITATYVCRRERENFSYVFQKNWQICNTATQLCQINDKRYILQVLRINIDRSKKL